MMDTRKYNYSNLSEKDKQYVDGMIAVMEKIKEIGETYTIEDPGFLENIFCQTAAFIVKNFAQNIRDEIIKVIISRIDSYDHVIENEYADDPFYGYED